MPRKRKPLSEALIKDLIEYCLADEILLRVPLKELTQEKMLSVRAAARDYLSRQGSHSLDIEEVVRTLLPGFIAEVGVEPFPPPLYGGAPSCG